MPPAAMAASVVCTMAVEPLSSVTRPCSRQSSSRAGWGNFGAGPNPPQVASKRPASSAVAAASSPGKRAPGSGLSPSSPAARSAGTVTRRAMAPTRESAWDSTSSRRSRQASSMACRTRPKPGVPWASRRGKYVPAKKGRPSGVRKTVMGQPPWPVMACTASM